MAPRSHAMSTNNKTREMIDRVLEQWNSEIGPDAMTWASPTSVWICSPMKKVHLDLGVRVTPDQVRRAEMKLRSLGRLIDLGLNNEN